jgi:hypothetical protein
MSTTQCSPSVIMALNNKKLEEAYEKQNLVIKTGSFISIQPLGRFYQEPEPSKATSTALAHCILGMFLGLGCQFFLPPLDVPTFSAKSLHVQRRERPLAAEGGTPRGREMFRKISPRIRFPGNSRDLLHAANLRHGTDGFTFPTTEGVLRIFSPLKIRRLRPGLNQRPARYL